MKCLRNVCVLVSAVLAPLAGLDAAPALTKLVPASAPLVLHVRNFGEMRSAWSSSSYAQAWADPEIRKFFAPTLERINDSEDGFAASVKRDTGLTPEEFFGLFSGEAIFAIKDFAPYFAGQAGTNPQILLAVECGASATRIKELIARQSSGSEDGKTEVEEEFQGETMHVEVAEDEAGDRTESQAWAIVDGVFLMAEPKSVLQEAIVAVKKGGVADPIAQHASFASAYRNSPDTHALVHIGLDGIISPLVAMLESTAGQTDENGNPTGPAAQLAQVGLTPSGLFHALGLDALRSMDLSVVFRERETVLEGDFAWTEKRGLLRMAAFGEPPVPKPEFIPDTWVFAGVDNFSVGAAYRALMETLAEVSPMLDGMVRQQIKATNAQMGIDIDRDLFGSLGDVTINGYALPAEGASPDHPMDQFIGVALSNPDAFRKAFDAILGGTPLGQMAQPREYLGETLRTIAIPNGKSVTVSVTRTHLFISIGGPSMVESAIQGLQRGAAKSFWKKPGVAGALDALPPGASSILVADMGRMMNMVVDFLAQKAVAKNEANAANEAAESDEEAEGDAAPEPMPILVDPSARPSAETIAKYWSLMSRGVYHSPHGFHFVLKVSNGR